MIAIQKVDGRYVVEYIHCEHRLRHTMHMSKFSMPPVVKTLIFDTSDQMGEWFHSLDQDYELEENQK